MGLLSAVAGGIAATGAYRALPAHADSSGGTTRADVDVTVIITLSDLTPSFTLSGLPGATPTTSTPVDMRVTTNNAAGYTVTVEPHTANLVGAIAGNPDVIPADDLEVEGPAQGGSFAHLTFGTPLVVDTKATLSEPTGDPIHNDYRITIPPVRSDTYTGVLDYVASAL